MRFSKRNVIFVFAFYVGARQTEKKKKNTQKGK